MKLTKRIDIVWWGWVNTFMGPFITWGTWSNSFRFFILGPLEFRKWQTLNNLDRNFWNNT
jgi:hypothetical protein